MAGEASGGLTVGVEVATGAGVGAGLLGPGEAAGLLVAAATTNFLGLSVSLAMAWVQSLLLLPLSPASTLATLEVGGGRREGSRKNYYLSRRLLLFILSRRPRHSLAGPAGGERL